MTAATASGVDPYADPTKVMGRRVLAYLVDSLIGLLIALAVIVPYFHSHVDTVHYPSADAASDGCYSINRATWHRVEDDANGNGNLFLERSAHYCIPLGETGYQFDGHDIAAAQVPITLLSLLPAVAIYVVLQGLTGWTPGKLLLGLRVVREDGQPPGLGWALLRWLLLHTIDGLCFIGFFVALSSKGHRRLGDMAASTFVVRKRFAGAPIQVPGMGTAAPPYQFTAPGPYAGPPAAGAPNPYGRYPADPAGAPPPPAGAPAWGPAATPPPAADATVVAPTGDGPHWDEARGAYIQYDREQGAWLQWNDGTQAWGPIDA